MKILLVGGDFNNKGGRPSGYIKKFDEALRNMEECEVTTINGGQFAFLNYVILRVLDFDTIFWFANVSNDEEKIVRDIKKINPKCMIVTSKANFDKKYSDQDLIARTLENKANLLVEFKKDKFNIISARVIDPLGNIWSNHIAVEITVNDLIDRLKDLMNFTRIGSEQIGDAVCVPEEEVFFLHIRDHADTFHNLIHGVNTSRFLGNSSFRCTKGFPSFRGEEYIFVSKRNLDKRLIGTNGFVACNPNSLVHGSSVQYYGEHKPSVDTPIQLCLYNYYKNINYMIHSHVYVKDAPFTRCKIPCGAIEEASEIFSVFPQSDINYFAINLKGHGSLIAATTDHDIAFEEFEARPVFEGEYYGEVL